MQDSFVDRTGDWADVPRRIRAGERLAEPWESRFGALRCAPAGRAVTVGQIGQSLDGRIATLSGHRAVHQRLGGAGPSASPARDRRRRRRRRRHGARRRSADSPCATSRDPAPSAWSSIRAAALPASARAFADDGVRRWSSRGKTRPYGARTASRPSRCPTRTASSRPSRSSRRSPGAACAAC